MLVILSFRHVHKEEPTKGSFISQHRLGAAIMTNSEVAMVNATMLHLSLTFLFETLLVISPPTVTQGTMLPPQALCSTPPHPQIGKERARRVNRSPWLCQTGSDTRHLCAHPTECNYSHGLTLKPGKLRRSEEHREHLESMNYLCHKKSEMKRKQGWNCNRD